jgi:hypothetical protein
MKIQLPQRRIWRAAIYIVSTFLVLLAIDLVLVHLARRVTPGPRTTYITEPTLADGRIDYLTAVENRYGQGATPENNAAVLLLQAFGREALPKNQPRDGVTARMGMAPLPDEGDYLQLHRAFLEKPEAGENDPANDLEPLMLHPWKAADHPRTAAWLEANEKPLVLVAEAAKKPRYFVPLHGGQPPELCFDILIPHVYRIRESSRALVCRAMLKAGSGDFAGAREDLITVHYLARLLSLTTSMLIDHLVSYVMDGYACSAEMSILNECKLIDAAEARRWLAMQQALPPISDYVDVINFDERLVFLELMQYASQHGMNAALRRVEATMASANQLSGKPAPQLDIRLVDEFRPIHIAEIMEEGNRWYDRFAEALKKPTSPERRAALTVANDEFARLAQQGQPWRTMEDWGWPNFLKIEDRRNLAMARRSIALASSAIVIYHTEQGNYPPALAEAAKSAGAGEMPLDPFTAQPLIYRPQGDRFVLYSVGPNLRDDQGRDDDVATTTAAITAAAAATTQP